MCCCELANSSSWRMDAEALWLSVGLAVVLSQHEAVFQQGSKSIAADGNQPFAVCTSYLGKLEDAIDRIDLSIRLVMNMYREVASKPLLKTRLLRSMSRENCLKFEMVLQKVHIPMDGMGLDSQESEESVGQSLSCVLETPTPCRALVPQPTVLEKEAVPEHQEARFPFKRVRVSTQHFSANLARHFCRVFERIPRGNEHLSTSSSGR